MNPNVSMLTAYIDEHKMPLIKKSLFNGNFFKYLTVQEDVKGTVAINIHDMSLVFQSTDTCGATAQGEIKFTQRELSTCPIQVFDKMCLDKFNGYYPQSDLAPGSFQEKYPYEGLFAEQLAEKFNEGAINILVNGDTDDGSGTLALCDGLIKLASEDEDVIGLTGPSTSFNSTNVLTTINSMAAARTDNMRERDTFILVGWDVYDAYIDAVVAAGGGAGMFHFVGQESRSGEFQVIGKNITLVAIKQLNNTGFAFMSYKENVYLGTDKVRELGYEGGIDFRVWYDQTDDLVYYRVKARLGIQFAFGDEVVTFTAA